MKRTPSIDLLRVIVVGLVVVRHVWPVDSFVISVGSPFFFFVAGWLWRVGSRDVRGEMRNRSATLVKPYVGWFVVLWSVLVPVTFIRGSESAAGFLRPLLGGEHAVRPFSAFWFISALFVVACLLRLLDRFRASSISVLGVALLACGAVAGPWLAGVPYAVGVAIFCLAFGIAGRALREFTRHLGDRALGIAAAAAVVTLVVAFVFPPEPFDLKHGDFGTPLVSAVVSTSWTWLAILSLDRLFSALPVLARRIGPAVSALAAPSIGVVLSHALILFLLDAPSEGAHWSVLLLALVVPWAAALLLERSVAAPWFIGPRRRPCDQRATE